MFNALPAGSIEANHEGDAENYDADERVIAGYAMAEFYAGDKLLVLPGQSRHIANFAISYEKAGFSSKASWNVHGKYIDVVGAIPDEDVYYDNHTQVDISVSQRITRNLRVYADFLNLANAPLRYYLGTTNRPIQEEYYRWWSMFGLKLSL
jgi:outer membrane receptor protein involved in Fe transport